MGSLKKWRTKKSSIVLKTDWFSIRRDDCITGDRKRIRDFYVMETPSGALVVPITADGNVILVRQYRQSLGKMTLECPAGYVDDEDRSPRAAARRELSEETGYEAGELRKLGTFNLYSAKSTAKVTVFLAVDCKKTASQSTDGEERIEVVRVGFKKALEMVREGEIDSCDSAAAILLAEKELK
jgi:8-oxo-dGTP pyrophosphatase MutT (NUDIX family)